MKKLVNSQSFDADVARAETLDASWYLDPSIYDLEMERIFARTWQAAARLDQLKKPGDYISTDVAGEPIVIARDGANQLRGYFNVCPHRAGIVARGSGNRKTLQCLYHGWTFDLNGCLLRTPGLEGTEGFDPAQFDLKPIRVDTWGPYVFVNLDLDAPPLSQVWGDALTATSGIDLNEWKLVERAEYLIDCNWKVYLDNYAEGYHVPFAHPGISKEMNLDDYYVDTWRFHSQQRVHIKPAGKGNAKDRRYPTPGEKDFIKYHVMFPNFMIDEYPDNLSVNVVKPVSLDKTLLSFEWYFKDEHDAETMESMVRFADEVQYEDIEICEYVQRGLKSRSYNRGRFSARHENGVHHFQSLVLEYLHNDDIPLDTSLTPREDWNKLLKTWRNQQRNQHEDVTA